MQKSKITLSALAIAVVASLTACGGGGDGGSSTPPAADAPAPKPPAPVITVQGTAPTVTADPLAVILVPQGSTTTKTVPATISAANFAAQFQKATSEGAYTQFGVDANSLVSLSTGKVVDVAGNGDFSIGRWTDGSSSVGSFNSNQGTPYVVGKPLKLQQVLGIGKTLNCSLIAATSPTAASGNFAPGKVNSATAVIDLNGPTLQTFSIDVAIGSDTHAASTVTGSILNGVFIAQGVLQQVQTMGTSQTNPLLAFGYAIPTPSSGDVTGVVVLKCQ